MTTESVELHSNVNLDDIIDVEGYWRAPNVGTEKNSAVGLLQEPGKDFNAFEVIPRISGWTP